MGKYLSKCKDVKKDVDESLDYVRDIGHQYQELADSVDGTVRRAGDVANSVNGSVRKAGDIANTYAPLIKDGLDQSQKIVTGLQQVASSANETTGRIDNISSKFSAAMINLSTICPILLIYASVFMLNLLQQIWFRSDILTEIFSYGYGAAITITLAVSWHLFGQRYFRIGAAIFVTTYFGVMVADHLKWFDTSLQNGILNIFKLLFTASIVYAFYFLWNDPTIKNLLNRNAAKVATQNTGDLLYRENINPEGSTVQNESSRSHATGSPVTASVHNNPVAASTPLQAASNATVEHEQIMQEPQTNDRRHLNAPQRPPTPSMNTIESPQRPPTPSMNTIESTSKQRLINMSLSEPTSSCGSEAYLSNMLQSNTPNTIKHVPFATQQHVHTQQQNGTMDVTSKKKKMKTKKEKKAEEIQRHVQEELSRLLGNNQYGLLSSNNEVP